MTKTIFEKSVNNISTKPFFVESDNGLKDLKFKRTSELNLPDVTELEVMRHYKELSDKNFCIEKGFYPLGSCTMKYNPRLNEETASLKGFVNLHPMQKEEDSQGALELIYNFENLLAEITGMDAVSLQPMAGAQGEFTGMMVIKKYFEKKGELNRKKVIIPDTAHGTNPASATMAGFECVEVKSDENGLVDVEDLKKLIDKDTAAIMMTNPNTLGLYETHILEISKIMHDNGSLLYYDGANFNAIMGHTNPALMGFDVVHLNLHKTFSTPHGGGGPGSGPVCVKKELAGYLPVPRVKKIECTSPCRKVDDGTCNGEKFIQYWDLPDSIGKVATFYGNFGVLIRAYTYILTQMNKLKEVSEDAVLNANYMKEKLKSKFCLPYDTVCMHEFVLSSEKFHDKGVNTLKIAKRLMESGFHPPTIYFPLLVHEAMMIEPTETESKETLDKFIDEMLRIADEIDKNPEKFDEYPISTPVQKIDEVTAARNPNLRFQNEQ